MRFLQLLLFLLLTWISGGPLPAAPPSAAPVFEKHIRPIFLARCGKCHSSRSRKGGLDLSNMAGLRKGGESGESVVLKTPAESLLWSRIDAGDMPPEDEPQLTEQEKSLVQEWIQAGARSTGGQAAVVTQHQVYPYLYTRCIVCHGARKQSGGLDLRTAASMLKGGQSGPAIVPGKPQDSLILRKIHDRDMPPPREMIRAGVRPMEAPEIALLTAWIRQGAREHDIPADVQTSQPDPLVSDEDRNFWAFQTPRLPDVPDHSSGPVDAFVARKLKEHSLTPASQATRLVLIRRVAFDLTGLPPEWQDVQRFLTDESDDWYAQLVDFYLDSPHYGWTSPGILTPKASAVPIQSGRTRGDTGIML